MFPIVLYVNKSLFYVFFAYLSTFPALFVLNGCEYTKVIYLPPRRNKKSLTHNVSP